MDRRDTDTPKNKKQKKRDKQKKKKQNNCNVPIISSMIEFNQSVVLRNGKVIFETNKSKNLSRKTYQGIS